MKRFFLLFFVLFFSLSSFTQEAKNDESENTKIHYIDSTIIYNNLDEIIGDYFGETPILVVIWASWAYPCFKELAYSTEMHDSLSKYNIPILYFGYNEDRAILKGSWENKITSKNMKGYHYKINDELMVDIQTRFFGGNTLYIPKYILIKADGKIINNNLPRPSTKSPFYKRIRSDLKK